MHKLFVLASVFGFAIAQFLQIAWISKAYGAHALGMYGLIVGVMGPLLAFLSVSQRYSVLVEENFGGKAQAIVRAGILFAGLALYIGMQINAKNGWLAIVVMAVLVGFNKILEANFELRVWTFQRSSQWGLFAYASICRIAPAFAAIGVAWILQLSVDGYLLTLLAMSLVCLTGSLLIRDRVVIPESLTIRRLFSLVISLVPIGFAAGLESWAVIWPRFFLEKNADLQDVGKFLLFTQISAIFGLIASASIQSDMPKIKTLHSEGSRFAVLKKAIFSSVSLGGVMLIGAAMWWIIPSAWIGKIFGGWVGFDSGEIFFLPLISWLWYCGGYFSNVLAICRGKNWLMIMSACIAISLCFTLYGFSPSGFTAYEKCIAALAVAFGVRFVLSASFLARYVKNG